jgi:hypothetical protein
MPRPKSFLQRLTVEKVARAHNCQHNQNHRLETGDVRLKVTIERTSENYCADCAIQILNRDIDKLRSLVTEIESMR